MASDSFRGIGRLQMFPSQQDVHVCQEEIQMINVLNILKLRTQNTVQVLFSDPYHILVYITSNILYYFFHNPYQEVLKHQMFVYITV